MVHVPVMHHEQEQGGREAHDGEVDIHALAERKGLDNGAETQDPENIAV